MKEGSDRTDGRLGLRTPRRQANGIEALRVVSDVSGVALAFALAHGAYSLAVHSGWMAGPAPGLGTTVESAGTYALFVLAVFWKSGLYNPRPSVLNLWELRTTVGSGVTAAAFFLASVFLFKQQGTSRLVVLGALLTGPLVLVVQRRLIALLLRRRLLAERRGKRVLLLGGGEMARLLMKKIVDAPHVRRTVMGFLDDLAPIGTAFECSMDQSTGETFRALVLGRMADLEAMTSRLQIEELLIDGQALLPGQVDEVLRFARGRGIDVGLVPHFADIRADELHLEDLSAVPVLRPNSAVMSRFDVVSKRSLDLVAALGLTLVLAPLWLLLAALVRLESGGPVLFEQERVGLNGQRFRIFKFRTMWVDADPYARSPVRDRDARITRVGRLLRVSGLDEVPQLINVLRGEMSLVGPRPEMPFLVERYTSLQLRRLRAKPGITGIWQLSPDRHAEIHENLEYDLYYIQNQSLLLDCLILLETALRTPELVLKSMTRSAAPAEPGSAPEPLRSGTDLAESERGYVLVALDQRQREGRPRSWEPCLTAASGVSELWPVKILVAESNRDVFTALLTAAQARSGTAGTAGVEFLQAANREEIQLLATGAHLVLTDLTVVDAWARGAGSDVLRFEPRGLTPAIFTSDGAAIAGALNRWLPPKLKTDLSVRRAAEELPAEEDGTLVLSSVGDHA